MVHVVYILVFHDFSRISRVSCLAVKSAIDFLENASSFALFPVDVGTHDDLML